MGRVDSIHVRWRPAIPRGAKFGLATLVLGILVFAQAAGAGAIYMYVDARGVTHFTNDPRGDKRFKQIEPAKTTAAPVRRYREPRIGTFDDLIHRTARSTGVPPALVKAVIAAESAFDAAAVSHKGAQGLMQLMPATAASLGVHDPFEPSENVDGGSRYLREMIDRYGDLGRALAAYNAGPRAVDRYGGIPPYRETRDYVDRVLTYYRRYHGDFPR